MHVAHAVNIILVGNEYHSLFVKQYWFILLIVEQFKLTLEK